MKYSICVNKLINNRKVVYEFICNASSEDEALEKYVRGQIPEDVEDIIDSDDIEEPTIRKLEDA